jgi:hypothetical protein
VRGEPLVVLPERFESSRILSRVHLGEVKVVITSRFRDLVKSKEKGPGVSVVVSHQADNRHC